MTTPDFSRGNYSPPGVYISETEGSTVGVTGVPPTLVAIVGPAQGFQTNTEQVTLSEDADGDPVVVHLSKQGIDTDSVSVKVAATDVEVEPTDYSLTKVGTTTDQTYTTDLLPAADPEVGLPASVFVTYQYTDPTYYDPRRFESFEDVKDVYGEPLNTVVAVTGEDYQYVTSALSLASMVAFQNGATELVLCAAEPPPSDATTESARSTARRDALNDTYTKLDSDPAVNVLVSVTTGIGDADAGATAADFKTALYSASQDGYYRFGIIGFDPEVDTPPDQLLGTAGVTDRRLMLAYAGPTGLLMYSGAANSSFSVGHQYLASAYAGRMAALPVQYAITKQVLSGFSGLAGTPLANSLKNQYSAAGIAVTEINRFSQLQVRHGVTTDTSSVNTREASVVRARDAMVTALQEGMDASGLIGAPIDADTLIVVKSAVAGVMEALVFDEVILSYSNLAVRQISTEPTVVEVKFAYKPAYPLNYIIVSFSIDMTTGQSTLTEQVAA